MIRLIIYFLVLLGAVWVGLKIAADPGYLLIAYQKVTVEMPVWLAVLGDIVLFIVLYWLFRLISNIRSLVPRLRAWSRARRVRRAWQRTHRGLLALAAGDWKTAEKDLLRAASRTDTPALNYLAAARAAQSQGDYARRDEHLRKIQPKNQLHELAVGLTRAQLQLEHSQYEQALATLQHLQQIAPKNETVLKLLKRTYYSLHDWNALEKLLPQLEKRNVLSEEKLTKLRLTVYEELLKSAASNNIEDIWNQVPKNLRSEPTLLSLYIHQLAAKNPDEAEQILRQAIQKNPSNELIAAYGNISSSDADKQLRTAEGWLKNQNKNAVLLLTLGRLCMHNQLWGKARSYLEASLGIAPSPETYLTLAKLLEQLGENTQALQFYKQGLAISAANSNVS